MDKLQSAGNCKKNIVIVGLYLPGIFPPGDDSVV